MIRAVKLFLFFVLIGTGFLLGTSYLQAEEKAASETPAQANAQVGEKLAEGSAPDDLSQPVNLNQPEANIVADLKKRAQALEARAHALASKEKELKALEGALQEQLKKLQELRDEYGKLTADEKKQKEEKLARVVETLEGMSPKTGAVVLAQVDEPLAVQAMHRLSTQKLSKLMQAMDPKKSARLVELYTGSRNLAQAIAPGTAPEPEGGKKP